MALVPETGSYPEGIDLGIGELDLDAFRSSSRICIKDRGYVDLMAERNTPVRMLVTAFRVKAKL
jgi:hypothetical protein